MTNLFKKTLVAVAVLSVAGVANAAGLKVEGAAVATQNASLEAAVNKSVLKIDTLNTGLKNTGADLGVSFTPAATFAIGDVVSVKVSGGSIVLPSGAGVPALQSVAAAAANGTGVFAFDSAKSSASEALFNVTTATVAGDLEVALKNLHVNVSSATAGSKLSVTVTVVRAGVATAVDSYPLSNASATPVLEFKQQYVVGTTAGDENLKAVISTGDKRLSFSTASGHSASEDVLKYTLTDNSAYAFAGSITQTTTTIKGDFGYLLVADNKTFNTSANADGKLSNAEIGTLITYAGPATATFSVSEDLKTLTLTESGNSHSGQRTLTFKTPKSVAGSDAAKLALATQLAPTSFTATFSGVTNPLIAALSYTSKPATDTSVGSWGLDGSSTFVNYMPYGDTISQMIYATNNGSVDGSVTVSGYDEAGKKYGPYKLATVKAKSVLNLSALIKDKLVADGVKTGKVALTIDTDAPSVVIYGAYNVGGTDRALVINK